MAAFVNSDTDLNEYFRFLAITPHNVGLKRRMQIFAHSRNCKITKVKGYHDEVVICCFESTF